MDILSDYKFMNQPKQYLDYKYRTNLLINKFDNIFNYNTIFCLQEVGSYQLKILQKYFLNKDFHTIYYGDLAIFFSVKRFQLVKVEMGPLGDLDKFLPRSNRGKLKKMLKSKNKHYIMVNLKCKESNKDFTISNTHLSARKEYDDIKLLQSYVLLKLLENEKNAIFLGDLNSVPSSNVIDLILNKSNDNKMGKFKIEKKFISVYEIGLGLVTTHASNKYTPIFSEMIDYIFVDKNLKFSNVIKIPNKDTLSNKKFYPDKEEPSDHFMIGCEIEI